MLMKSAEAQATQDEFSGCTQVMPVVVVEACSYVFLVRFFLATYTKTGFHVVPVLFCSGCVCHDRLGLNADYIQCVVIS